MPVADRLATVSESPFWSVPEADLLASLATSTDGLTSLEAERRLHASTNRLRPHRNTDSELLLRQVRNPITLLLLFAAILALALGEVVDSSIVLAILVLSWMTGFWQERGAVRTVDALLRTVRVHVEVLRDGRESAVPVDDVVPGDVVVLRIGDVIPADGRVLSEELLRVNQSTLTGEVYPRHKSRGRVPTDAPVTARDNCVFLGSHVDSGSGRMVVVDVGSSTHFGRLTEHVVRTHLPTSFERGIAKFGQLLLRTTIILTTTIFVFNTVLHRPIVDSLLFSLALAVGLTPQMLPGIVALSLARGAALMARSRLIVKRLDSIEDCGSLDVLCVDKTGTLTVGNMAPESFLDAEGNESSEVRRLVWWNARLQTSFANPIDVALVSGSPVPTDGYRSVREFPFDFHRRMLSVVAENDRERIVSTKGAFESVANVCTSVRRREGVIPLTQAERQRLASMVADHSQRGARVLAVASKSDSVDQELDESGLVFEGFVTFADPPKPSAAEALFRLGALGVSTKLVTGDDRRTAVHVAAEVGLPTHTILLGRDLQGLDDRGVAEVAERCAVYCEMDPLQKERLVRLMSESGHTVGFLGDGVNDAPALHAADVGISVDGAVDVAKRTADLVLLEKDLTVLVGGITAGRRVFANTLKYVRVTTSANFGNMISLAIAAVTLPFLPLLPFQILLLNFLSDLPGTTIATDRVDDEAVAHPVRWEIGRIRSFMLVFGLVSTVVDVATFVVLRHVMGGDSGIVRTGWFVESTLSELAAMLVLRTDRSFLKSAPSRALIVTSAIVAVVVIILPFGPLADDLGFVAPSLIVLGWIVALLVIYVSATEAMKRWLARRSGSSRFVHSVEATSGPQRDVDQTHEDRDLDQGSDDPGESLA